MIWILELDLIGFVLANWCGGVDSGVCIFDPSVYLKVKFCVSGALIGSSNLVLIMFHIHLRAKTQWRLVTFREV